MVMKKERIIFIGDVHGHFEELQELLVKCEWSPTTDRLILLGDLVDRGPKSIETVRWARENSVEVCRGNHDQKYLDIQAKKAWHEANPGQVQPTVLQHKEKMEIFNSLSKEDLMWMSRMPYMIDIPELNTIAVHAGFKPGVAPEENSFNTMMHIRFLFPGDKQANLNKHDYTAPPGSYFWADRYTDTRNVVYGHHVGSKTDISIHKNNVGATCYGIDTGVCFKGTLTALIFELPSSEKYKVVQVSHKS